MTEKPDNAGKNETKPEVSDEDAEFENNLLFSFEGWDIIKAVKKEKSKKTLTRFIARKTRQEIVRAGKHRIKRTIHSEVIVAGENEFVSAYAYAIIGVERQPGLMRADAFPITVIAMLLGLKAEHSEIIIPGNIL